MYSEPYLGNVAIFAGNFAPRGWALCSGQLMSIAQNTALFSILGTTFGGDGQTTFALPDLRGRIAIHPDNSNYILGEIAGTENITITTSQMPAHTHAFISVSGSMAASTGTGGTDSPATAVPAKPASDLYNTSADSGGMAVNNVSAASPIAGASNPVPILSPYLAMNYVIALEGLFPSRN
jgi:microcystin-dependent protein